MIKLDNKYVLHIPIHKYENKELTSINIEKPIEELISKLNDEGYTSFYKTKITGYYENRRFDEIIFTIFTESDDDKVCMVFREWFNDNNSTLKQESFAYEHNNSLIIETL